MEDRSPDHILPFSDSSPVPDSAQNDSSSVHPSVGLFLRNGFHEVSEVLPAYNILSLHADPCERNRIFDQYDQEILPILPEASCSSHSPEVSFLLPVFHPFEEVRGNVLLPSYDEGKYEPSFQVPDSCFLSPAAFHLQILRNLPSHRS